MRFRLRPEGGWLSLFLLALVVNSVAWSIEEAGWAEGLFILQWCALGGIVFGFLLAQSGWRGRIAHSLGAALGTSWVLFLLLRPVASGVGWLGRLGVFTARLLDWLKVALSQGVSGDNLVFLLLMAFLVWILGYLGAWFLFRSHTAWPAVILSGVSLLINRYYGPPELDIWLIIYLFTALLLIIRVNLYGREKEWREGEVRYGPDSATDFLRDGALFSLLVIAIAWLMPMVTQDLSRHQDWGGEDLWDRAQEQFNRLFFSLRSYRQGRGYAAFGDRLILRGGIQLGSEIVMVVEAPEGRYWRGMVYDYYDGRGWANTDSESIYIAPHTPMPQEEGQLLRRELAQRVTLHQPTGGQLFAASQPVWTDLPVEARLTVYSRGQGQGESVVGVAALTSKVPVGPQRPYTIVSSFSQVSEHLLRQGSYIPDWTIYRLRPEGFLPVKLREDPSPFFPSWVRERYLQLPPTLPSRVKELARELTEGYDNIYDRAVALESYLRQISYDEDIEAPPPDRDAVDYFLFDSREGYCDYYASAMVVMARAVGIPARLAVGYAGGEYSEELGGFVVRQNRAHAWVEIFFPTFGWIEFEPTAAEPPIDRLREGVEMGEGGEAGKVRIQVIPRLEELLGDEEVSPGPAAPRGFLSPMGLLGVLFLLVLLTGGFALWLRRRQQGPPAERAYRTMASYARLLGLRASPCQTPLEYGTSLAARIPEEGERALRISQLYCQERFSRQGINEEEGKEVTEAWNRLHLAIWKCAVRRGFLAIRSAGELFGRARRRVRRRPSLGAGDGGDGQG